MIAAVEPGGYIVAEDAHGRLHADWDGEVHPARETGEAALADCHGDGYTSYALYALVLLERT